MPRSLLAGMTDYSHQSLEDIMADLHNWVTNLTQVCATLEKDMASLEGISYWEQVDYDIRSSLMYSLRFFKTSIEEINSILSDFQDEIQTNHVKRIQSLARTAVKTNEDIEEAWHQNYYPGKKDYGNSDFAVVEEMGIGA